MNFIPPLRLIVEEDRPLGVDHEAYMILDGRGTAFTAAGLNLTLRDLAHFGDMMRRGGRYNDQQIIPRSVVDDIASGGDREKFGKGGPPELAGWSYRNQWRVPRQQDGAYMVRGLYGQSLYIDPESQMVIARFSSLPVPTTSKFDAVYTVPAFQAVAARLRYRP